MEIRDPRYERKFGSWYLMSGSEIRNMVDQVSIAFALDDAGETVMMKHGSPKAVAEWLELAKGKFSEVGFPDQAAALSMVTFPKDHDVDEVNRCIQVTGYIGRMLEDTT